MKSTKTIICENLDCQKFRVYGTFLSGVHLATKYINKDALGHLQRRTHYVYCLHSSLLCKLRVGLPLTKLHLIRMLMCGTHTLLL